MAKKKTEPAPPAPPLADGEQLLMDLREERERMARLASALCDRSEIRERIRLLRQQLKAAQNDLRRIENAIATISSAEMKRLRKERV